MNPLDCIRVPFLLLTVILQGAGGQVDGIQSLHDVLHHLLVFHVVHPRVRSAGHTEVDEPVNE